MPPATAPTNPINSFGPTAPPPPPTSTFKKTPPRNKTPAAPHKATAKKHHVHIFQEGRRVDHKKDSEKARS